jgi:hypothetical protein
MTSTGFFLFQYICIPAAQSASYKEEEGCCLSGLALIGCDICENSRLPPVIGRRLPPWQGAFGVFLLVCQVKHLSPQAE